MDEASPARRVARFGVFEADLTGGELRRQGLKVKLQEQPFRILVLLLERRGELVSRDELRERLWPSDTFVDFDHGLNAAVNKLREALGDSAESPRFVETVPRRGYRFVAPVESPPAAAPPDRAPAAGPGTPSASLRVIALTALAAALLAGLVWKARTRSDLPQPPAVLRTMQVTVWPGLDIHAALSRDGGSVAYSSDHGGSFEIYVRQLTPGARDVQVTMDGAQNFQPSWSPDGKQIAYYSRKRGGVWVVPALGGAARQLTPFGSHPAWSPDGALIAFESAPLEDLSATTVAAMAPSTLWVVPAAGGEPVPVTQVGRPPGGHGATSWSPDGKRLAFVVYSGVSSEIWSASLAGREVQRVVPGPRTVYDPVHAPDGHGLYYGAVSELGDFVLEKVPISPATGLPMGEPAEIAKPGGLARIKDLSISGDGKRLAYSAISAAGTLLSIPVSPASSLATGPAAPLIRSTSYRKALPAFSPDGRKIAFVEFRGGTNQDVWVMDVDGSNMLQLTTDPAVDWSPSWFPDSDRVAFQSNRQGRQGLWSVSIASRREGFLADIGQDVGWPRLSPDGKQVAFNSTKGGTMNIWAFPLGGSQASRLSSDKQLMGFPCWSPDGKWLGFQAKRGEDTHVMIMASGGGQATQLTADRGLSWTGSFSPDGDKIAFAGWRDGLWNIWWVSRSTRKEQRVTSHTRPAAYVRYPAWSPRGDRIVYEYGESAANVWLMDLR